MRAPVTCFQSDPLAELSFIDRYIKIQTHEFLKLVGFVLQSYRALFKEFVDEFFAEFMRISADVD